VVLSAGPKTHNLPVTRATIHPICIHQHVTVPLARYFEGDLKKKNQLTYFQDKKTV